MATYRFAWLEGCKSAGGQTPNRAPTSTTIPTQSIPQGQPYQLNLSAYFTDPDGQPLTFSATGLPAGLSVNGTTISGTPSAQGTTSVSVTARDPGNLKTVQAFALTVTPLLPTGGNLFIASVTTVECREITPTSRQLTFTPVYSGGNGSAITFQVQYESLPTTEGGPYSLRLYTDNPTITLLASQAGNPQVSLAYNWLAVCGTPGPTSSNPAPTSTTIPTQSIPQGQPYQLNLSAYFTDPEGQPLTFSATGLPTGLSVNGTTISGTPSAQGTTSVSITARDPGNLEAVQTFTLTVTPTLPTGGNLSISSVTTVECRQLTLNSRQLTFTPVYSGGNGGAITFLVQNESLPTTDGGPYSLPLYTDNPTITLLASQAGSPQVSFAYNWRAVCGTLAARQGTVESTEVPLKLSLKVYPNPVQDAVTVEVMSRVAGTATFEVLDMQGRTRQTRQENLVEGLNEVEFRLGSLPTGMYLIKVSRGDGMDALGQQGVLRISKE